MLARYGGEEFSVIMPGATLGRAADIAERVRCDVAAMALPHVGVATDAIVTISMGVATAIPGDGTTLRNLIETADQALYEAKRAGRNRVSVSSDPVMSPMAPTLATEVVQAA
jgi:two-component system chemotaxis family response regulator WspR